MYLVLCKRACGRRWTDALFTLGPTKEHTFVCPAILSKSLCVSEIGGGGEIRSFSIRLLFRSTTDGDSSGERDLVL